MERVVFITDKVYPYFIGGQEKRIFEYANILVKNGKEVSIISMKWWKGSNIFTKDGIKYVSIFPKVDLYKKNGKRRLLFNFLFGARVFFYVIWSRADIVDLEVFPYFPLIFGKLAKILARKKFIIVSHWCECQGKKFWKKYSKTFWFFGYLLEFLCYKSSEHIIAISEFTKNRIEENYGKSKKVEVIHPFFLDINLFEKVEASVQKKYDIIYFGRLIFHKHVEKIIELTKKLKDCKEDVKVLIIGNGPDEEKLKKMTKDYGLLKSIIFENFVESYAKLIAKIKSAKIMIFPSEREGFGIAVLEANACGLPVLVMDYPENASKYLIKDGKNGFVCKNDNDMAENLLDLLKNKNIFLEMSKFLKNKSLDYYSNGEKVIFLYNNIINRK